MSQDLSIDHLAGTSALFNGVAIPGRSLEAALSRYAFNVFVATDDEIYSVTLRGSATAIRFRHRDLLICTQHQLAGVDRQQVCMMSETGKILVTSGGMRHFSPSTDTDAYDLVAFDFTEPVEAHPEFRPRFFNLRTRPAAGTDIVGLLLTGCPFDDQKYDVADSNHIGLVRRQVLCTIDEKQPSDSALLRVSPRSPLSFRADGMSGGSAFAVHHNGEGFQVDFAGIIVRGGGTAFHVIKGGIVLDFLEGVSKLEGWAS